MEYLQGWPQATNGERSHVLFPFPIPRIYDRVSGSCKTFERCQIRMSESHSHRLGDDLLKDVEESNLVLSSRGWSSIARHLHEEDFQFIVGEKSYSCNVMLAEFLSPKISRLREADPTICVYRVEQDDSSSHFGEFLSLPFESKMRISQENFDFLVSVSRELENREIVSQLASLYFSSAGVITTANAVGHLRMKDMWQSVDANPEVEFIAKNFSDVENLSALDIDQLRRILGHKSLRIQSEDSLYNFICQMIAKDESFSELLEFVNFKFLGSESIHHFVSSSESYIFEHWNSSIWKSLCARLVEKPHIRSASSDEQKSRFGSVIIEDEVLNLQTRMSSRESELNQKINELTRERDNNARQCREKEQALSALKKEKDDVTRERDNTSRQLCEVQREKTRTQKDLLW